MEPALIPLLLLSSLLFLSTLAVSAAASDDAGTVLDTDGHEVKSGDRYYVLPLNKTHGGLGFRPRYHDIEPCPVMNVFTGADARRVRFDPWSFGVEPVMLDTDVFVAFDVITVCMKSTVWALGPADPVTHRSYVLTGADGGSSDGEPRHNRRFRIERFQKGDGGGYKFAFCHRPGAVGRGSSDTGGRPVCGDLGLFVEDRVGWLGLGGSPFPVVFKKVHGAV